MRAPINFDTTEPYKSLTGQAKVNAVLQATNGGQYVNGDVFNGQVFNGTGWLPAKKIGGAQEGATIGAAAMGVPINAATPDTLLHGIQKGDSDYAASLKAQADLSAQQAARAEQDAQRGYQLGSRDPRVEADKDAATRAAAAFNQKMAQTSGAAGGGAAVLAATNVQDASQTLAEHRTRADSQHLIGAQHMATAEGAKQDVVARRAAAAEATRAEREQGQQRLAATALSKAGASGPDAATVLAPFTLADMQDYVEQRTGQTPSHGGNADRVAKLTQLVNDGVISYDDITAEISKLRTSQVSDRRVKRLIKVLHRRF
jgi:hypothetical protein